MAQSTARHGERLGIVYHAIARAYRIIVLLTALGDERVRGSHSECTLRLQQPVTILVYQVLLLPIDVGTGLRRCLLLHG